MEQGEFKLKDAAGWQKFVDNNNKDPYGAGVMRFAERWGRAMQFEIDAAAKHGTGETVEHVLGRVAAELSHEADDEGITGFMYGCAVGVLAKVWEHGEALRRWHNVREQLHDEGERANENGEVLNPALIVVNPKPVAP